ncbi:protein phosphatase 2C domain-containing protein [Nocardiopsis ganjiahuensis]|uniref:protein phosphatase 2C domain-containing protein n=1 Tax=Nocardiopsis ganjiahuensis TaxID=239984 RepID=UPI00034A0406|nr:protein phosphatase 2C domain-containing protein [Nocardiopsis ganjiahuensis]
MPFLVATAPGRPDHPNEDFAAVTATAAVLLDGVSAPVHPDNGCSHGVSWHTRRLGALLLAGADAGASLREALAEAITAVSAAHEGTCDLGNQQTPSATVVAVRVADDHLEYLVLSDSVLLTEEGAGVRLIADTRLDDLRPRVAPGTPVRAWRNVPGGFWTAGADPRAAEEALAGTVPRGAFLAMTDGASRAVEVFGDLSWEGAFELVRQRGPSALVERVRDLEAADPSCRLHPRGKARDDATALWWEPAPPTPS